MKLILVVLSCGILVAAFVRRRAIFVPVLLAVVLGPGVGQLYNREFKKGFFLILVSIVVFFGFTAWIGKVAMPYVRLDQMNIDLSSLTNFLQSVKSTQLLLGESIQRHVSQEHPVVLFVYEGILGGLWVYGVVDAYLGALRMQARQQREI